MNKEISLDLFDYTLPDEHIAQHPLKDRSASRLLVYRDNNIEHTAFKNLKFHLPPNSTLVFNNTRVIPARLYFRKPSGAVIEIFLLEPVSPFSEMNLNLLARKSVTWKCMVGNAKKWKSGRLVGYADGVDIAAEFTNRVKHLVTLTWEQDITFAELLERAGKIPLPPYIKRNADYADTERYQTVYATTPGAVAAPTAGLHFTREILNDLDTSGFHRTEVTLHVGAGTFQPVMVSNIWEHQMHREFIQVKAEVIKKLANAENLIAVGTTSLRTLESLYWLAVMLKKGNSSFVLQKEFPYQNPSNISYAHAMEILVNHCRSFNLESIEAYTELMIAPGYNLKSIRALLTNFHLPKSTLIMLVHAVVSDAWKMIYEEALEKQYRFLSYGDSSLLFV